MSDSNSEKSSVDQDPYNRGGMIAFLFSFIFVLCFFVYIAFFHPGVDLKENIQVANSLKGTLAEAPAVDISKIAEPWVANADMVKAGQKIFSQNCAMCHGTEGKGDGPAGMALNPKPRNLVEGPWKKGGGFIGWYTVLQEGLPPSSMASFKHLKTHEKWALVQFIDSITKAKVKEEATAVASFAKGPSAK